MFNKLNPFGRKSIQRQIDLYIKQLKRERKSPQTIRYQERMLQKLDELYSNNQSFEAFLAKLQPASFNTYLTVWRRFVKMRSGQGVWDIQKELKKLKLTPIKKAPVEFLNPKQLKKFEDAIPDNLQDRLILYFLIDLGLRRSEIAKMRFADISDNGWVRVHRKGGDVQNLPLSKRIRQIIYEHIETSRERYSGPNSWLFRSTRGHKQKISTNYIWLLVKKVAKDSGLEKKISPHTLRHTFATRLAQKRVPIHVIQEFMNHKDLEITKRYLHAESQDLRDAQALLQIQNKLSDEEETMPVNSEFDFSDVAEVIEGGQT